MANGIRMVSRHTFCEEGEVNFGDLSVKTEYCLKMGFGDVPGEVGDNDYFRFVVRRGVHINVACIERTWRR
jgi:hypothetical protein